MILFINDYSGKENKYWSGGTVVLEQPVLIEVIRDAILKRRPIAFSCGATHHALSPHALGTRLGVWHVYGWDSAASPPDWKCIELRAITSDISMRDGEWQRGVRVPHSRSQCLHFVYTEVDPPHDPLPPWARDVPDDQDAY
jgi:hypothetical protein